MHSLAFGPIFTVGVATPSSSLSNNRLGVPVKISLQVSRHCRPKIALLDGIYAERLRNALSHQKTSVELEIMGLAAGQSWTYRAPQGFESSRLLIGAIATFGGEQKIVLASAIHAPRSHPDGRVEMVTIPFIPMTEAAFLASVVSLDETDAEIPAGFAEKFDEWKNDPKGLRTFTVGFDGYADHLIADQVAEIARLAAAA
jgi:hypothetical protein